MIKMYLKFQDIFTRPNEFLPDMSGGQTELREDCTPTLLLNQCDQISSHCIKCQSLILYLGVSAAECLN